MKPYHWTNEKVIDFVNWYIDLHKLPFRYKLENQTIVDSFKNGDDFKVWYTNIVNRTEESVLNDTKEILLELNRRLEKVGTDFDWNDYISMAIECKSLQEELKNIRQRNEM